MQFSWLKPRSWQIVLVATLLPMGAGIFALSTLTNLPEFAECEPTKIRESASLRLFCAQKLASEKTEDSLLRAIHMLDGLPPDHPFQNERDRLVRQWSTDLLTLAEETFQKGKLDDAIALTRRIPFDSSLDQDVEERVDGWRDIWSKAEDIYEEANQAITDSRLQEAMSIARELATIGNQYWETTQFQELTQKIQVAREDSQKQAKSKKTTKPKSDEDLMTRWEREQVEKDIAHLKQAQAFAAAGDVESLRKAIDSADRVLYGTPRYGEAQRLASTWKRRIETVEDQPYLDRAVTLAQKGDVDSLRAAIDEANQIFLDRPLYAEAQQKVSQWMNQIQQLQAQSDLKPELAPASSSTTLSSPAPTTNPNPDPAPPPQ